MSEKKLREALETFEQAEEKSSRKHRRRYHVLRVLELAPSSPVQLERILLPAPFPPRLDGWVLAPPHTGRREPKDRIRGPASSEFVELRGRVAEGGVGEERREGSVGGVRKGEEVLVGIGGRCGGGRYRREERVEGLREDHGVAL